MRRVEYFQDPVHGQIEIEPFQQEILRTPHFARLTQLRQLGVTYFTYPSANHTRYEHCLGVAHLARVLIDNLKRQQPSLDLDDRDRRLLVLAAQCHDLGHGCTSHAFESWVHERYPTVGWSHEAMGVRLLRDAIAQGFLPCLQDDNDGVDRIEAFIMGAKADEVSARILPPQKHWMLDVVSNSRNGIDVDKMDYLCRDALHLMGGSAARCGGAFSVERILHNARVSPDGSRLCYHEKVADSLFEMFHQRWSMFRCVYSHDATVSVEVMLQDIFNHLDQPFQMRECLDNCELYLRRMTDNLFHSARLMQDIAQSHGIVDHDINSAMTLIDRVERRQFYECIARVLVDASVWERFFANSGRRHVGTLTMQEIFNNTNGEYSGFVVHVIRFHYGRGERNPLDDEIFFNWQHQQPFALADWQMSRMLPRQFSEYCVRLFYRGPAKKSSGIEEEQDEEKEVIARVKQKFNEWLNSIVVRQTRKEQHSTQTPTEQHNTQTSTEQHNSQTPTEQHNTQTSTEQHNTQTPTEQHNTSPSESEKQAEINDSKSKRAKV